jgi:hypothetical protein
MTILEGRFAPFEFVPIIEIRAVGRNLAGPARTTLFSKPGFGAAAEGVGLVIEDELDADSAAGGVGDGGDELDEGGDGFVVEKDGGGGADFEFGRVGGREEEVDEEAIDLDDGEDVGVGEGDGFAGVAPDFSDESVDGTAHDARLDGGFDFADLRFADFEIGASAIEFVRSGAGGFAELFEALDLGFLEFGRSLGDIEFGRELGSVEPGDDLIFFDDGAFLNEDLGDDAGFGGGDVDGFVGFGVAGDVGVKRTREEHPTSDVQHPTSNDASEARNPNRAWGVERWAFNGLHWVLDVGC